MICWIKIGKCWHRVMLAGDNRPHLFERCNFFRWLQFNDAMSSGEVIFFWSRTSLTAGGEKWEKYLHYYFRTFPSPQGFKNVWLSIPFWRRKYRPIYDVILGESPIVKRNNGTFPTSFHMVHRALTYLRWSSEADKNRFSAESLQPVGRN